MFIHYMYKSKCAPVITYRLHYMYSRRDIINGIYLYIYTYFIITFVVYNIIIYRNNSSYIHIHTYLCNTSLEWILWSTYAVIPEAIVLQTVQSTRPPPVKLFLCGGIVIVNRSNTHTYTYTFIHL